jgi:hypothetical protein
MGVTIQQGYSIQSANPVDDRLVVSDSTARFALSKPYEGLLVYETSTDKLFICIDPSNAALDTPTPTDASDWKEITNQTISNDNGFPFYGKAYITGSLKIEDYSLVPGTEQSFSPNDDNYKVFRDSLPAYASSTPNNSGLGLSNTYNQTNSVFDNEISELKIYKKLNFWFNPGLSFLDYIDINFPKDRIPLNINLYGATVDNSDNLQHTLQSSLDTQVDNGSIFLLAEGATTPTLSSNIYPTSNPLNESLLSDEEGTITLRVQIPEIKRGLFSHYSLLFDGILQFNNDGSVYTTPADGDGLNHDEGIYSPLKNYLSIYSIKLYNQIYDVTTPNRGITLKNDIVSSSKIISNEGYFDTIQVETLQRKDGTAYSVGDNTDVALDNVTQNIIPNISLGNQYDLGSKTQKWENLFAVNTFFGGVHEINLETKGLDQMQEGTVLTLQNGTLHPCKKEADPLVMGIVSKGENFPIVLGAEPVLVTGKVEEGDYIITSKIKGHGKGINPKHIYNQQLFGKIIAQAIEKGNGKSYTIKAMIRKM